jgi:hypothetical protein
MAARVRPRRTPAFRTITRLHQLIAHELSRILPVVPTQLITTKEEAAAVRRFLLAAGCGDAQRFRRQNRAQWRLVALVCSRAPEGYLAVGGELEG